MTQDMLDFMVSIKNLTKLEEKKKLFPSWGEVGGDFGQFQFSGVE